LSSYFLVFLISKIWWHIFFPFFNTGFWFPLFFVEAFGEGREHVICPKLAYPSSPPMKILFVPEILPYLVIPIGFPGFVGL